MIRESHRHGDKVCYRVEGRGRYQLTETGLYRGGGPLTWGKVFAMGYMVWSAHWYAFDPKTGRELGSFTREFHDAFLASHRIDDLVHDPECRP